MIEFASESTIKLIDHMGSDDSVIRAAQVSAKGENDPDTVPYRLINALMRHRRGFPFEHNAFTFFIETPIFVVREWQRHRISSFNEMKPKFYIPDENRKMINYGTKMKPKFSFDRNGSGKLFIERLTDTCISSWADYEQALENGVANEVARMVLPLNVYSQMYWTVNARSLMNFLSLRVESDDSTFRSYPQYEIHKAALQVEEIFSEHMPLTYQAFIDNGRVAP